MGGGDLAESVKSFPAAEKYCKRARGGCAPSLVSSPSHLGLAY